MENPLQMDNLRGYPDLGMDQNLWNAEDDSYTSYFDPFLVFTMAPGVWLLTFEHGVKTHVHLGWFRGGVAVIPAWFMKCFDASDQTYQWVYEFCYFMVWGIFPLGFLRFEEMFLLACATQPESLQQELQRWWKRTSKYHKCLVWFRTPLRFCFLGLFGYSCNTS